MKRIALSLAAIGVLCLAANQAFADRRASHSRVTHVTVGYGVQHGDRVGTLHHYRQAGHYRSGYRGHHVCGPYCGCGHVAVPTYVPRYPVAVPYYGYYSRPYGHTYYRPYRGFSYYGPGLSIGIGF